MYKVYDDSAIELAQCSTVWVCSGILVILYSMTLKRISRYSNIELLIAINILFLMSNIGSVLKSTFYYQAKKILRG